jgi:hypothetical protein
MDQYSQERKRWAVMWTSSEKKEQYNQEKKESAMVRMYPGKK